MASPTTSSSPERRDVAPRRPGKVKLALTVWLGWLVVSGMNLLTRRRLLDAPCHERRRRGEQARCLYASWHGDLWHLSHMMRSDQIAILVSTHRDGELVARVLARMGYGLVRGSSTRGGAHALREITRAARDGAGDLAFTIDGPKGPARQAKDGILYAASRTGLPIVPVGLWVDRAWHINSWDRLTIGKPLARVALALGDELYVPAEVDHRELLPRYGPLLEAAMAAAQARAQKSLC